MKLTNLFFMLVIWVSDANAQYCIPDFGVGCSSGSYINSLSLTGENSTAINFSNGVCNAGAYEDSTSTNIILEQGSNYYGLISSGNSGNHVEFYIDFNDDYFFDPTESIGGSNLVNTSSNYFAINIPLSASLNAHRLRIVLSADSSHPGINPCPWHVGTSGYVSGQVYDYTATIIASACDTPVNLSVSNLLWGGAEINWTPAVGATNHYGEISLSPTPPIGQGNSISGPPYTAWGGLSNTLYYFHLRSQCSNSYSDWTSISFTTAACEVPSGLAVTISSDGTHGTIGWSAVPGVTYYTYVFSPSTNPPTGPGTVCPVIWIPFAGLTPDTTYCLWVRAICGPGDTSAWAGPVCATGPTDVSIFPGNNKITVLTYPNPVKNTLNISLEGNSENATIQLSDVTGRVINTFQVESASMDIDMSSLTTGIYFVRYTDNKNRQVVRVSKE